MPGSVSSVLRSLEVRLLVPLCVTIGAVLTVHALLGFRSTSQHLTRLVEAEIDRCTTMVVGATHLAMMNDRPEEVQAIISKLADAPELAAIRIYDKQGKITRSTDPTEIGHLVSVNSETCRCCHPAGPREDHSSARSGELTGARDGHEVLRRVVAIDNEPSCRSAPCHVHPTDQEVLGVLDVEMSMAPFDATINAARYDLRWTTGVLILASALVAGFFVRRVIHRPVAALYRGTKRIAAGDLETRIEIRGGDELARLGEAFNRMAADLGQARASLTDWSRTLERRVEAKTRELQQAERQVLHMETMASLGKLSATVAHELNNPMSGILAHARLVTRELADVPLDADLRRDLEHYLELIVRECSRCGAIIHNLLTFARRKGGAMAPVDVNEILDRCLMLIDHHLEMHDIQSAIQHIDGDPIIVADGGQIEQAMLAILINAIEAMQTVQSDRRLRVALRGDDDLVTIEIADSGSGIPPDVLPHIYEPFFSTKGHEHGVGLGLAVVYGIVNRHGGTIDVESVPGDGTTFRIILQRSPHPVKTVESAEPVTRDAVHRLEV